MPTYQYTCKACGEPHEAVQSFHDAPLTECPHCGGELRKVFSSVGVVFKGSGFYRNDSRKTSTSTSPAASTSGGADSSSKDSGSKDSGSKDSSSKDGNSKPSSDSTASSTAKSETSSSKPSKPSKGSDSAA